MYVYSIVHLKTSPPVNNEYPTFLGGRTTEDITKYADELVGIINQATKLKERLTPAKLLDAWTGKGQVSLRASTIAPPKLSREDCERVIVKFVLDRILQEDMHFTPYSTICYIVQGPRYELALQGKVTVMLDFQVIIFYSAFIFSNLLFFLFYLLFINIYFRLSCKHFHEKWESSMFFSNTLTTRQFAT